MTMKTPPLQVAVFISLIIYMSITYTALMLPQPYLDMALVEDGFFENVGFLGLFVASILFLVAAHRSRKPEHKANNPPLKQISYIVLALILFFGAGEEISWGQRIFGIETPELLQKDNAQDEINIHNLKVIEDSHISPDTLFTIFALTYTLLIPIAASQFKSFNNVISRMMPVPHWGLGLLFLANFILAKLAKVLFVSSYEGVAIPFIQGVQEIKESNYELLFFIIAAYITFISLKPARRLVAA